MPIGKYLKLIIGNKEVQVTNPEDLPISIDYSLEDPDNFQTKTSSQALALRVPASLQNDTAGNTFRNPSVMDLTDGQLFRSNQPFTIDENGFEIMSGKAFLKEGTHTDQPQEYEYDLFGDNADWKIDLEEKTLYDFLKHINFIFSKANIEASWDYDGTDQDLPYVFAPIRYRNPMGGTAIVAGETVAIDNNVDPTYLKPSLSKYWIIYWALKSVGFRVQSNFMDLAYFRRQVMPWTWGGFVDTEGARFNRHRFRAKSALDVYNMHGTSSDIGDRYVFWDLEVTNDSTEGMFDNNDSIAEPRDYEYISANKEMKWTYNTPHFGVLEATFSIEIDVAAGAGSNSDVGLKVFWYKNGTEIQVDQLVNLSAPAITTAPRQDVGIKTAFFKVLVDPGDIITAKVKVRIYQSRLGSGYIDAHVSQFQLDYFRIPLNGNINFIDYPGLKNYKFLDFLRGVIDEFNLSINTDATSKIVYIEPTHAYSVTDDPTEINPGYFNGNHLDWNQKPDLSKLWKMENYSDYDRELTFCYKYDGQDGILKTVQDRNINQLAAGKYVFPERFKTGKKEIPNRFFSVTMHYDADQFKSITDISPQLVCIIPENISNTSSSEAANVFMPKSCYYKGNISGVGGWRFDGDELTTLPFLFAVNYKDGGQDDPILSYSDEKISIGSGFIIGKGLVKRFFWQRLAIMRNGQFYNTWFRLRNVDVVNQLHREHISFAGHRWELVQIKGYRPLQDLSTACFMRRWAPVTIDDFNNTFPTAANVLTNNSTNSLDIKYAQLKGLTSDIPR